MNVEIIIIALAISAVIIGLVERHDTKAIKKKWEQKDATE